MNQEEFSIVASSPSKPALNTSKPTSPTSNNLDAITITLVSSTVGIVSIFMPKLLLTTGLLLGSCLLAMSGIFSYLTCHMLCSSARVRQVNSFPALCHSVLGKHASFVEILYALFLLGNIISNHVFVCKSYAGVLAHSIFPSIREGSEIYVDFTLLLLILINIAIVPFITSEDLTALKKISKLSGLFLLTAFIIVVATFMFPSSLGITVPEFNFANMPLVDWAGLKNTCGMLFLSMSIHPVVIDIHSELTPQSAKQTFLLIKRNSIFSFCLFLGFGLFGFLAVYQDELVGQVNNYFLFFLAHKKIHSVVLRIAQSMITFAFLVGNIFAYIPLIKIFDKIFSKSTKGKDNSNRSEALKENAPDKYIPQIKPTPLDAHNLSTDQNTSMSTNTSQDDSQIQIKDFENAPKIKQSNLKVISAGKLDKIYQDVTINEVASNYKKIAITLEAGIVILLFIIIKNRVPLYVVYNIVSAVCYPTMCLMIPGIIYLKVFSDQRKLTDVEKFTCYGVIGFGCFIFIFMINNLFA